MMKKRHINQRKMTKEELQTYLKEKALGHHVHSKPSDYRRKEKHNKNRKDKYGY